MDSCPPKHSAFCRYNQLGANETSQAGMQEIVKNVFKGNLMISKELQRSNMLRNI